MHRDVKPANIALAQPFFTHTGHTETASSGGSHGCGGGGGGMSGRSRGGVRGMSLADVCGARWALLDLGSAAPLAAAWRWPAAWPPRAPGDLLPRRELVAAGGPPPYESPAYSPPEVWGSGEA